MDHHLKFVISASEAETMAKQQGFKSVINLLPFIAKSSKKLARRPISGFSVAAVGLASDGRIFIGVNVEFPGLPLHHSIHAEQFLITNLSLHHHHHHHHPQQQPHLKNIVVTAYPCGHCRQFLQEIRDAPEIQIFVLKSDNKSDDLDDELDQFMPLSYFLPHRFGPDDLLEKDVPLILENRDNNLILLDRENKVENGGLCNGFSKVEERGFVLAALEAANKSHAPYSGCPSGVALIDKDGVIYKGSYMESAAYNPSMGPAQAAIIAYMAAAEGGEGGGEGGKEGGGGGDYQRIVGAVLVEVEGAVVRQEETVRLFLNAVIPKCEFHVFHCKKSGSN